jgi:hypothetical protein
MQKVVVDIGEMSYFLDRSCRLKQSDVGILICRQKYADEILKKFNMSKSNSMMRMRSLAKKMNLAYESLVGWLINMP